MNSDPEIKNLELNHQEKRPKKKKGILKKIKEFIINGLQRRFSGEGEDWGDW